jgi:enoyl-CoA hydratase/methylglutaconyl-CoA hydratase
MSEFVHLTVADGIGTITLDSQHNRNALSRQLVTELFSALEAAEADAEVKVVVLAAAGSVWCSGADLSEAGTGDMTEGLKAINLLQRTIAASAKPYIARIQGPVRAGGLGLVAACDIAIADASVTFALTEVRLGLAAFSISLSILPKMDPRAASYAFLTGDKFTAAQAADWGLLTIATDDLDAEMTRVLGEISQGAPSGLRETKKLLNAALVQRIDELGDQMAHDSAALFGSDEARAAMMAFFSRPKS